MTKKNEPEKTGAQSLSEAIDKFKKFLAEDINKVCDMKDTFTLLSSKNDEKVLNQVLKLITMFDTGGKITDKMKPSIMDEIAAESIDTTLKTEKKGVQMKPGGNIYEHVVTELKNGSSRV